jgi:predicted metal-dependent hydrolase
MHLKYLTQYSDSLQAQIRQLIVEQKLHAYLSQKYPEPNQIQTDKALYQYVNALKKQFLKNAPQVDKVFFDNRLDLTHHALGLNTAISRVQGGKLLAKKEIRIASLFKTAPAAFLSMIVVHELAHLKEREHDKAFYKLCQYMLPNYHQLEFDLRVYLTGLEMC